MSPSVHILWRGAVLCGALHGEPRHWGSFARWIGANDPGWKEHATCSTCREQAARLELAQTLARLDHDLHTPRRFPLGFTPVRIR